VSPPLSLSSLLTILFFWPEDAFALSLSLFFRLGIGDLKRRRAFLLEEVEEEEVELLLLPSESPPSSSSCAKKDLTTIFSTCNK
tara:strand:+ start:542 stop:793 length:252 start_codon:yes stop_codon:yes gene_type:complete